jgi:hypothetical protein
MVPVRDEIIRLTPCLFTAVALPLNRVDPVSFARFHHPVQKPERLFLAVRMARLSKLDL